MRKEELASVFLTFVIDGSRPGTFNETSRYAFRGRLMEMTVRLRRHNHVDNARDRKQNNIKKRNDLALNRWSNSTCLFCFDTPITKSIVLEEYCLIHIGCVY